MHKLMTVTYELLRPFVGTVREGDRTASWQIDQIRVCQLGTHQSPPSDDLVRGLHSRVRDENGESVPVEVLSLFDLDNGLREAFHQATEDAWAAVRTD